MKKIKNDSKRVNLTFDNEFYACLKAKADADFIKLGTWVKQFLKQNVKNNFIKNSIS
jgi:predicted HicB family RNase H-like nuclease